MIPKIIHYCWLSGDPYPEEIRKCMESWKQYLPDYEFRLWDANRFDIGSVQWVKQAFAYKKYAFAADYIRLYALYHFGGIYLDADVLVYKSFDDLLSLPYFVGHDQIRGFEAAVIGAEKGCQWIKDMLDSYQGKSFIKADGSFDLLPLPCRFHHVLTSLGYKFWRIKELSELNSLAYNIDELQMYVFDKDYFNSRNAIEVQQTSKSYCAHNYAGSWQKKEERVTLKSLLPKWMLKMIYVIGQRTWARNKYSWFQIPFENL